MISLNNFSFLHFSFPFRTIGFSMKLPVFVVAGSLFMTLFTSVLQHENRDEAQ